MDAALHRANQIVSRWLCEGGKTMPPYVRQAARFIERKEQAAGPNCSRDLYRAALLAREEIMDKGAGYSRRAQVRKELANYIADRVYPTILDYEFMKLSDRLRHARRTGTWGTRPNGDLVTIWDDKSNLARLDPDEAREETQRLAERYVPAIATMAKEGAGIHYAVFTLPNADVGKLALCQKKIFRRYSNMLRKQLAKKKLFPEIRGSIAVCESPLAAGGDSWNVHLNVILVTRSRFEPGLYKRLRDAWYWNVEIKPIKGDAGSLVRSFNELVKYATAAIPEKSTEKSRTGKSPAPAMTEWAPERFVEWWRAQHRFRRTRTYGELYGSKVPKPEPLGIDDVTWHGVMHCTPDRFYAQVPLIDLIPGDNLSTRRYGARKTGPP